MAEVELHPSDENLSLGSRDWGGAERLPEDAGGERWGDGRQGDLDSSSYAGRRNAA